MSAIADNLRRVRDDIAAACSKADRDPGGVTLVAVTKTVTGHEVAELYRLGVRDFGENRVADGLDRKNVLNAADARWHMIGHLQRNKAASALEGGYDPIHSVESPRLIEVLERECAKISRRIGIMLEVNIAGEAQKYGAAPDDLPSLAEQCLQAEHINLLGLMTMAPFTDDPETSRPHFAGLRRLRDEMEARFGITLPHLSMGMSGDYAVAVEEGATMVRVGSALFQ